MQFLGFLLSVLSTVVCFAQDQPDSSSQTDRLSRNRAFESLFRRLENLRPMTSKGEVLESSPFRFVRTYGRHNGFNYERIVVLEVDGLEVDCVYRALNIEDKKRQKPAIIDGSHYQKTFFVRSGQYVCGAEIIHTGRLYLGGDPIPLDKDLEPGDKGYINPESLVSYPKELFYGEILYLNKSHFEFELPPDEMFVGE